MSSDVSAAVALGIGESVRAERQRLGWSTRHLARAVGVSQPFISNVENGRTFPSVEILLKFSSALNVPVTTLLPVVESTVVVGAKQGMRRERLASQPATRPIIDLTRLAAYRTELKPGEVEPKSLVHDGEDFLLVIEGEAEVLRESLPALQLSIGDSAWIDGSVPHRLACPAGAADRTVVLVVTATAGAGSPHSA